MLLQSIFTAIVGTGLICVWAYLWGRLAAIVDLYSIWGLMCILMSAGGGGFIGYTTSMLIFSYYGMA